MKGVVRRLVADDERAVLLPQPELARYVSKVEPQFVLAARGQVVEVVVSKPVVAVRVADTKHNSELLSERFDRKETQEQLDSGWWTSRGKSAGTA